MSAPSGSKHFPIDRDDQESDFGFMRVHQGIREANDSVYAQREPRMLFHDNFLACVVTAPTLSFPKLFNKDMDVRRNITTHRYSLMSTSRPHLYNKANDSSSSRPASATTTLSVLAELFRVNQTNLQW